MFTKVEAVKASCNGTLCDRQSSFVQTGSCGCLCLYFNRFSAIVLDIHDSDIHDHWHKRLWESVLHYSFSILEDIQSVHLGYPMALTADNDVYLAHTREIRVVAAS